MSTKRPRLGMAQTNGDSLRVAYDRPETVIEAIEWLVDVDTIELRDLALNLLADVETLKAAAARVRRGEYDRVVARLRPDPTLMCNDQYGALVKALAVAADYLETTKENTE